MSWSEIWTVVGLLGMAGGFVVIVSAINRERRRNFERWMDRQERRGWRD
jgi:hypothetical protein